MQRSKVCCDCGLNLTDINTKDIRIVVNATDLIPLWEEILQMKLCELDPDATLSKPALQTILGTAKDPNHGLFCRKCFNSYNRYHKDCLSLLENMMKVLSKGILSEAISSAAKSTTFAGNKRSRSHSHELPSSKRLYLMSRFNDSDTTTSD